LGESLSELLSFDDEDDEDEDEDDSVSDRMDRLLCCFDAEIKRVCC
jgi:hypothetical protein